MRKPVMVSVIIPCYNEQDTIRSLLDSIKQQTFPKEDLEIVIADGLSSDATRQIITDFQAEHPELRIKIVDNLKRNIPAGLNMAIKAAVGEILIRLDAHSMPYPDYIARCVAALQEGVGENIGGRWEILPGASHWQARAIAVAAAHPLGAGDARYRLGGEAQLVDTVPFGAFHRELVERIGYFDETLLTNEDYEFNYRIRQAGGRVWFDPQIRSKYIARKDFHSLALQYWRYGYWKARMLRRHPRAFRWRQLAGLLVWSLLALLILSPWFEWARRLFLLESTIYLAVLLFAGIQSAIRRKDANLILGVPLAIAIMHFAWGSAFTWSLLRGEDGNSI